MRGSVAAEHKKEVRFDEVAEALADMSSNRLAARQRKPHKPQIPGIGHLDLKHRSQLWINMAKERARKAKAELTAPLAGVWAAVTGSGNDAGEVHVEIPDDEELPNMLDIMDNSR